MILDFSFTNFGPVKDKVNLSFEATSDTTLEDYYVSDKKDGQRILKMGVIYGPNASGKTTILEALDMLRDLITSPLDQKSERFSYNKFKLDKSCEKKPTVFELNFYVDEIKYSYYVKFNFDAIVEEKLTYYPNLRPAVVFNRSNEDGISKIKLGSTIDSNSKDIIVLEGNTLPNNTVMGAYSKSNVYIEPMEDAYHWFLDKLTPMVSPHHSLLRFTNEKIDEGLIDKNQVVELLSNADLNIIDLDIVDEEIEFREDVIKVIEVLSIPEDTKEKILNNEITNKNVIFKHSVKGERGDQIMELEDKWESSGTIRYYGLTGAILTIAKANKILFVDELDHSLHPDLMKHIILNYIVNTKNSQLLFTTHNLTFLKERDILRNDAIWFTEKGRDGAVDLFSLADFKSSEFRKESSVYNAYNLGKLGAKPNVTGSFFKNNFTDG